MNGFQDIRYDRLIARAFENDEDMGRYFPNPDRCRSCERESRARQQAKLDSLKCENVVLKGNLRDAQARLKKSQNQMERAKAGITLLSVHVDELLQLKTQINDNAKQDQVQDHSAEKELDEAQSDAESQYQKWYTISSIEIDNLKEELNKFQTGITYTEAMAKLRSEIKALKNELQTSKEKYLDFDSDVESLANLSKNAGQSLSYTRTALLALGDELAQLCSDVCNFNGEVAPQMLLDQKSDDKSSAKNEFSNLIPTDFKSDLFTARLEIVDDLQGFANVVEMKSYVDKVSEQIKNLRTAVENSMKNKALSEDKANREEVEELQEQVSKMKNLLFIKQEQFATLRDVIKSNADTAESMLTSLKTKYEEEKMTVNETMTKLRNELNSLKKHEATFSSPFKGLRSMFTGRCDDYATKVDELNRQVKDAKEKHETLIQLLRNATDEKLKLKKRLEKIEGKSDAQMTRTEMTTSQNCPIKKIENGMVFICMYIVLAAIGCIFGQFITNVLDI